MKSLLLEIGTEEIPARFIPGGIESLKERLKELLDNLHIEHGELSGYATPRRLAVFVENVSEKQKGRKVEVIGPPKKAAFDEKGNPTPAAIGFARSQNVDLKKLAIIKTDRGEYIGVTIEETKRETKEVLAETLPKLITSLQFPKSMRWGDSNLRFARPIHWITVIFGNDIIPLEIDGLKSSDMTRGHRFMSPATFKIKEPSDYLHILANNYVIAAPEKRREIILEEIKKIESSINGRVREDKELLDTVTFLVEYPVVISGDFDTGYLSLPKELLITVMKSHQKFFSVEDNNGNLLPHFILISNTKAENNEIVKRGAERVLKARLEDARFYFNEDTKKPLWDYVEKLKKVTFQEKLGSVYEKVERIAFICSFLVDVLSLPNKEKFLRAAMLSKTDLVTGIVREFPELHGYIGMTYAKNSGEDAEIALALYEHHMPRFSGDVLPSDGISTIVSLADKIDNIASFFLVGLIPTGSEDPYGLRRQAIGIINILQSRGYPLSLELLIEKALQGVESYFPSRKALRNEILRFFYQRLEVMFLSEGYSYDIVNSVLSTQEHAATSGRYNTMKDMKNKIEILSLMKEEPGFSGLLTAAKRVYNILSKTQTKEGDTKLKENLLAEPAEKGLYNAVMEAQKKLIDTKFKVLFELESPINFFFDSVLVMDKNPEISRNRLALLLSVKSVFDSLGDFSKIVTDNHR